LGTIYTQKTGFCLLFADRSDYAEFLKN